MANPARGCSVSIVSDDEEVLYLGADGSSSDTRRESSQSQENVETPTYECNGLDSYPKNPSNQWTTEDSPVELITCPYCLFTFLSPKCFAAHISAIPDSLCGKGYMVNGHFLYDASTLMCLKCNKIQPTGTMTSIQQLIIHVSWCPGTLHTEDGCQRHDRSDPAQHKSWGNEVICISSSPPVETIETNSDRVTTPTHCTLNSPPPPPPPRNVYDVDTALYDSSCSRMTLQPQPVHDPRDEQLRRDYTGGQVTHIANLIGLIKKCGICSFETDSLEEGVKHIYDHNMIRCPRCFEGISILEHEYYDHVKKHFVKSRSRPEHIRCSYCKVWPPYECNYHKMWDHVIQEHLKPTHQNTSAASDDDDAPVIIGEIIRCPDTMMVTPRVSAPLQSSQSATSATFDETATDALSGILIEAGSSKTIPPIKLPDVIEAAPQGGVRKLIVKRVRYESEELRLLIPIFVRHCNNIWDPANPESKIWNKLISDISTKIDMKPSSIKNWFYYTKRCFMIGKHPSWAKSGGVNQYNVIRKPGGLIEIVRKTPRWTLEITSGDKADEEEIGLGPPHGSISNKRESKKRARRGKGRSKYLKRRWNKRDDEVEILRHSYHRLRSESNNEIRRWTRGADI